MSVSPDDEKSWPPGKRLAALRAELDGRLAALEGGARWADHGNQIKWLGSETWELEQTVKASSRTAAKDER